MVLEEFPNANVRNNIGSTTRHPRACNPQEKAVPLGSRQNINTSFAYPSYGVTSKRHLEDYFDSKVLTDTKIRILEKELKD